MNRWPCEIEFEKRADGWRLVVRGGLIVVSVVVAVVAGAYFHLV
jgi:hypothetical protein